jgi:hypothetical protein
LAERAGFSAFCFGSIKLPSVLLFFEVINIARENPNPLLVSTTGFGVEIALLLTWIGGTLLWGLASLLTPSVVAAKPKLEALVPSARAKAAE